MSAKEERDLAALLHLFALGMGEVEEFQERLLRHLVFLAMIATQESGPLELPCWAQRSLLRWRRPLRMQSRTQADLW